MSRPLHEDERLSALVDGTLDPAETAEVEAHVSACAECRELTEALRATVTDLRALERPAPPEIDVWAIRGAVAKARKSRDPRARYARLMGAAAAVLLVAGLAGSGMMRDDEPPSTLAAPPAADVPVATSEANYDQQSAGQRLVEVAGLHAGGSDLETARTAQAEGGGTTAGMGAVRADSAADGDDVSPAELARCAAVAMKESSQLEIVQYEVAWYEQRPAILVFYRDPQARYELWVYERQTCDVLFFTQARPKK